MSWHFSRALVEGFSQANCSDIEQFAPLKSMTTHAAYSWRDKMTESFDLFQFGMMSDHSTANLGADLLTWYRAGSHAQTSALREQCGEGMESTESQAAYGPNTCALSMNVSRDASSEKTQKHSKIRDSTKSFERFPSAGMFADGSLSALGIADFRTSESASGFSLPTPTSRDWKDTSGMGMTRPDGRTRADRLPMLLFQTVHSAGIKPVQTTSTAVRTVMVKGLRVTIAGRDYCPELPEWLMGWPIGWTELRPLEMAKFQEWRRQHGKY